MGEVSGEMPVFFPERVGSALLRPGLVNAAASAPDIEENAGVVITQTSFFEREPVVNFADILLFEIDDIHL